MGIAQSVQGIFIQIVLYQLVQLRKAFAVAFFCPLHQLGVDVHVVTTLMGS